VIKCQLEPVVGQEPNRHERPRHHGEQHRRGQDRCDDNPPREVFDLGPSLGHFLVFTQRVGFLRIGRGRDCLGRLQNLGLVAVAVGRGLDDQLAVDHVHAAGEPELAGAVGQEARPGSARRPGGTG